MPISHTWDTYQKPYWIEIIYIIISGIWYKNGKYIHYFYHHHHTIYNYIYIYEYIWWAAWAHIYIYIDPVKWLSWIIDINIILLISNVFPKDTSRWPRSCDPSSGPYGSGNPGEPQGLQRFNGCQKNMAGFRSQNRQQIDFNWNPILMMVLIHWNFGTSHEYWILLIILWNFDLFRI